MSGRRHLLRPRLSAMAHAKPNLQRLEALLTAAKRAGRTEDVARLEREKAWALVNSLVP